MKNKFILPALIILILVFGIFLIKNSGVTGDAINVKSDSIKINEITISMKNYNYYPQEIKLKYNEKTRIFLDKSVAGCYRSFAIRDFGVAKYLPTTNDYIEFTPNKKGTFRFSCGMGMGSGTFIVE